MYTKLIGIALFILLVIGFVTKIAKLVIAVFFIFMLYMLVRKQFEPLSIEIDRSYSVKPSLYSKSTDYLTDPFYIRYKGKARSKCEDAYVKCMEENSKGDVYDLFCWHCKDNGDYADRVYNPMAETWFELDSKSGEVLSDKGFFRNN